MSSFIIGGITYFLGLVFILSILILVMMDNMGNIIGWSILAGMIAGSYYGIKWSKEGN